MEGGLIFGWQSTFSYCLLPPLWPLTGPLSIFGSLDVFRLQGGYVGQVLAPWGNG